MLRGHRGSAEESSAMMRRWQRLVPSTDPDKKLIEVTVGELHDKTHAELIAIIDEQTWAFEYQMRDYILVEMDAHFLREFRAFSNRLWETYRAEIERLHRPFGILDTIETMLKDRDEKITELRMALERKGGLGKLITKLARMKGVNP